MHTYAYTHYPVLQDQRKTGYMNQNVIMVSFFFLSYHFSQRVLVGNYMIFVFNYLDTCGYFYTNYLKKL